MGGCAGEAGLMSYSTINEYIQNGNDNYLDFNPSTGTIELVINNNILISYDTPETMEFKHDFASKACFRGFMWWAVDMKKANRFGYEFISYWTSST
jgi:GH18 family chitinase